MAGLRRSARNKPGGFAGRLAIAGRAWKPHWPIKDDLVQVVHDDDQGVAAWWAATVVGNNRDAFLFNEEEPEPLWRVEYADVGNGIEREDQITEDRIRKRFQDPAAMQEGNQGDVPPQGGQHRDHCIASLQEVARGPTQSGTGPIRDEWLSRDRHAHF